MDATKSAPPKGTKERIRDWLVKFGIEAERIQTPSADEVTEAPPELKRFLENLLVIPYPVKIPGNADDLVLEANVVFDEKWIQIKLLLIPGREIPPKLEKELYRQLLIGNFNLNEVTYSISTDGDIFVEADMPVNTSFENFESEYGSIEFGADYFLTEIIPKLNDKIELKQTYNPVGSNIYI